MSLLYKEKLAVIFLGLIFSVTQTSMQLNAAAKPAESKVMTLAFKDKIRGFRSDDFEKGDFKHYYPQGDVPMQDALRELQQSHKRATELKEKHAIETLDYDTLYKKIVQKLKKSKKYKIEAGEKTLLSIAEHALNVLLLSCLSQEEQSSLDECSQGQLEALALKKHWKTILKKIQSLHEHIIQ